MALGLPGRWSTRFRGLILPCGILPLRLQGFRCIELLGEPLERWSCTPAWSVMATILMKSIDKVSRARGLGFRKIKLHETHIDAIAAARQALPVEAGELMVDVNCPWSVAEASAVARQLRALELTWLEEPVGHPTTPIGLAQVRQQGVPLATGENAAGVQGIKTLLMQQTIDVVQPSVAKVGGIGAMLEVLRWRNSRA